MLLIVVAVTASLKAIHPFIVRNWRKATKGSIRASRNAPSDFANAARRSVTSAIGGVGCFSRRLNIYLQQLVAVGTGVASGPPPHRSERDVLPHSALMIRATADQDIGMKHPG